MASSSRARESGSVPKDKEEMENSPPRNPRELKRSQGARRQRASAGAAGDGDHDDDDDNEMLSQATQQRGKRARAAPSQLDESAEQEGYIESIHVTNFMCHTNLRIDLSPQINFITGDNGSGKSALLLALSLCLGAPVTFTQRGSKFSSFVKTGARKAVLRVVLSNRGVEAYKPDLYGQSITVERTLTAAKDGKTATAYRFLSESGQVVSTNRAELKAITDQFGIQISNPCIIMMQETSRDFLGSSTPKKKYELFEEATQLKQIEKLLEDYMTEIASIESMLSRKNELLPKLQRQFDQCKKEHEQIQHLKQWKEEIESLKQELVWAQVQELEAHVNNAKKELEESDRKLLGNEQKVAAAEVKLAAKQNEDGNIAQQLQDLTDASMQLNSDLLECQESIQDVEKRKMGFDKKLTTFPKKKEAYTKRIAGLEAQIAQAKARGAGDDSEQLRRLKELAAAKEKLLGLEQQMEQVRTELEATRKTRAGAEDAANGLRRTVAALEREREHLMARLRDLDAAAKNEEAIFGAQVPAIKELIRKHARLFRVVPVGPIGSMLKLRTSVTARGDFDASVAAEFAVAKVLDQFWCDNHEDARALQKLMRDNNKSPVNIIVAQFRDRVHAGLRVPPEGKDYVRLVDCFECTQSPAVLNVLVDVASIDGVVVMAQEGFERAAKYLHAGGVPNLQRVLLPDLTARSRAGQGIKTQPGDARSFITRLARPQSQRKRLEGDLADAKAKLANAQAELDKAAKDAKQHQTRAEGLQRSLYALQDQCNTLHDEVRALERPVDGAVSDTADFEGALLNIHEALRALHEEERVVLASQHELERELAALVARRDGLDERCKEQEAKRAALSDASKALQKVVKEFGRKIADSKKQLAEYRAAVEAKRVDAGVQEQRLSDALAQATATFPQRMAAKRTVAELEKTLMARNMAIRSEEQLRHKSVEDIERDFVTSRRKLSKVTKQLATSKDLLGALAMGLKKRRKRLHKIRGEIGQVVTVFFNANLTQRGYEGSAQFNHDPDNKSLDVSVNLNPESQASQSQNVASLSGGETSYATVSLLLALWEAMEPPFRILDEFDIFMDDAHRNETIRQLIAFGRLNSHRQFVFLSPLDDSAIPREPGIAIHKLEPPLRDASQTRITQYGE